VKNPGPLDLAEVQEGYSAGQRRFEAQEGQERQLGSRGVCSYS
jgi:hypothetical protein